MKFRINKKNLIPDFVDYLKILISAFITVYLLKGLLLMIWPGIENLSDFWYLVVYVIIITYIKGLFDLKVNGKDYL